MAEFSLLGRAVGAVVAKQEGLRSVHVAQEAPSALVQGVIAGANVARGRDDYAFLVSERAEDGSAYGAQEAIRFRQGDQLAVVRAGTADIASFGTVFKTAIGETFPYPRNQHPDLREVAESAGALVADYCSLHDDRARQLLSDYLIVVGEVLYDLYQGNSEGAVPWGVAWLTHFDSGLDLLAETIVEAQRSTPSRTLEQLIAQSGDACFGLPRGAARVGLKPKELAEAVEAYWGDPDSARSAASAIVEGRGGAGQGQEPWSADWEALGRARASQGDVVLALQKWAVEAESRAFLEDVDTQEFLNPLKSEARPSPIILREPDGRALPLVGSEEHGSVLLNLPAFRHEEGDVEHGPELEVLLPGGGPTPDEVDLVVKGANVAWDEDRRSSMGDDLVLHGRLKLNRRAVEEGAPSKLGAMFSVATTRGLLKSWEPRQAWVLPSGDQPGLAIIPLGARGKAKKPEWVLIPTQSMEGPLADRYEVSKPAESVAVVVSGEAPPATDHETEFESLGDDWWMGDVDTRSSTTISATAGGVDVTVTLVPATRGESEQSPLVAAATGRARDTEGPDRGTRESLRWRAEEVMGREVLDGAGTTCGRIALAQDQNSSLDALISPGGAYCWDQAESFWEGQSPVEPDPEFVGGATVAAFREAVDGLGLAEFGLAPGSPISRTSVAGLVSEYPDRLEALLSSYRHMVEAAKSVDAVTTFWAAYPFSVTVWRTRDGLSPTAVLLSPLHPLRLAWVAQVESEFLNARADLQRSHLAGTVAGWDLPLLGPADVPSGWMCAVATDPGEDQLFVGWSALARASADGYNRLELPVQAGRLQLPGSSSTGLTASAVDAAVVDYTRMHPQITTMTIDLPARSLTPRSVEVDNAVVSAASHWLEKNGADEGGVRVLDSNLRSGPIPRDDIGATFRNLAGAAFSWERYDGGEAGVRPCNLRILQESGTRMQFGRGQSPNSGHLGRIPFRRYWVQDGPAGSTRMPAITDRAARGLFGSALSSLEQSERTPAIDIRVDRRDVVGSDADWVVTGDAFLAPTELDGLLRRPGAGPEAVLWEWRPPLLSSETASVVGRRPFVTIARVPQSFKDRLADLVGRISSDAEGADWSSEIVQTLGSQGVGLSSLLGVGGNHAIGAVGFYLSLACLHGVPEEEGFDVVLPIDACAEFLRALTGKDVGELNNRRADLLGLRFDEEGLVMVPIEIKLYGFKDEGKSLPSPGSAALGEALDQLDVTSSLLHAVAEQSQGASPLWWNGLASLVEAGIRLKSNAVRRGVAEAFQALIDGQQEVRVGASLLLYFQGQPSRDGESHRIFQDRGALVFTADARTVKSGLPPRAGSAEGSAEAPQWWRSFGEVVRATWASPPARMATPEPKNTPAPSTTLPSSATGDEAHGVVSEAGTVQGHHVPASADPCVPVTRETVVPRAVGAVDGGEHEASRQPSDATGDAVTGLPAAGVDSGASSASSPWRQAGQGTKLLVGTAVDSLGEAPVYFWPGNTALSQMNLGVVGDLGTGKTQFLKTLIHDLRWATRDVQGFPASFLIFDYKKDYQQPEFLEAVGGVVLEPQNIPLNVLAPEEETSASAYQQARKFVDVLEKIYSGIGPKQRSRVTKIVREWYVENGEAPLLTDLLHAYEEEAVDSVTSILETFVYMDVFAGESQDLKSFEELLDGRVLVVALDKLGTDTNAKNALVALFLNLYYEYMLRSRKWPFTGDDPQLRTINSFLLVDEAHNIMQYEFPIVESLLLQGREFGFGVVLASQYLNHYRQPGTNYGEPLRSWFIHRVPQVRERDLRSLGIVEGSQSVADRISSLENHQTFVSTFGAEGLVMKDRAFYTIDKEPFNQDGDQG